MSQLPASDLTAIRFRCRTPNHWIEGSVSTPYQRLLDYLNSDAAHRVVTAEKASLLLGKNGSSVQVSIGNVTISTNSILLAIPLEDAPRSPDPLIRATLTVERVLAAVGPYQILGDVYTQRFALASGSAGGVLTSTERQFIVLADAVITHTTDPTFLQKCGAVCLNRHHVEFIAPVAGTG